MQNLCLGEEERSRKNEEAVSAPGEELLKYTNSVLPDKGLCVWKGKK